MSDAPTSPNSSAAATVKAVLWDFGGVILSSPFEAFNSYERRHGLPPDFIRGVNATNPLTNAWAQRHIRIAIPAQKERQIRWATELVEALRNGTNFTIPQSN